MVITSSLRGCTYMCIHLKSLREIPMTKVTISIAVAAALFFALAAGTAAVSTERQHHHEHYNSARHHANLPPLW
jgi:hypothetical protein